MNIFRKGFLNNRRQAIDNSFFICPQAQCVSYLKVDPENSE